MKPRLLLNAIQLNLTLRRLCVQLIENHGDFSNTVMLGIQPRGVFVSRRIIKILKEQFNLANIPYGEIDISFYRDDFRRREAPIQVEKTKIDFLIEEKRVVLVDDVLYTGRTTRAALDAMLDYGRPSDVEFLVLIDRRFSRHLPIQANYIGKTIDAIESERVKVLWKEQDKKDQVLLESITADE